jgi:iron complex transport system ATP-binding protein
MIARALIHRPKILILDEPCSGLDVYNREFLLHTLSALGQDMTIIYITHYVEEIRPMFDKTLLLRKGHIFAQGNTEEMFTTQKLTELLQYPVMVEKNANHIMTLSMDIQDDLTPLLKGGETL